MRVAIVPILQHCKPLYKVRRSSFRSMWSFAISLVLLPHSSEWPHGVSWSREQHKPHPSREPCARVIQDRFASRAHYIPERTTFYRKRQLGHESRTCRRAFHWVVFPASFSLVIVSSLRPDCCVAEALVISLGPAHRKEVRRGRVAQVDPRARHAEQGKGGRRGASVAVEARG